MKLLEIQRMKGARYGHVCDEIKARGKQKVFPLFNSVRPQQPEAGITSIIRDELPASY